MDPSWCPGCDRLILPKRYIVPVTPAPTPPPLRSTETLVASDPESDPNHPPPPPTPTPVPSSPEVRKKPLTDAYRTKATRAAVARGHGLGGGLVHGTGRIRPGGGLKPRTTVPEPKKHIVSPPKPAPQPKAAAAQVTDVLPGNPEAAQASAGEPEFTIVAPPASAAAAGKKTRVVISQEPTPLYCSDECRARDLKNSFIDSEAGGFGGAPVAMHRVAQMERVEETVERSMKNRRASASSSDKSATQLRTPIDASPLPIPSPTQRFASEGGLPPVPPNTLVDDHTTLCRTGSMSSASSTSTASSSRLPAIESKNSTIRASSSCKSRPTLPPRSGSFSAWGSSSKAALAPPAHTHFIASSSSSTCSSVSSFGAASALFEEEAIRMDDRRDGEDTCATTPSRRGSGSSGESKGKKRVSFAGDSKPPSPAQAIVQAEVSRVKTTTSTSADARQDWRMLRRRNPLLDANPLRDAVSVSPKDRVKASSLPSDLLPPSLFATQPSQSTPSLAQRTPQVVDTSSPNRTPRASAYGIAMWPEDEKRTTESARVHGELLQSYAMRFGPREGRSLVWGRLYEGRDEEAKSAPTLASKHDSQPDSRRDYWRAFEEREAEARARRKAEAAVQREAEEKVICELLNGVGMNEEDQPQARRMKQMAYDGMPGPAELRGLTYKFDRFLYPLVQPKPTIVEKTVKRWDEARGEWIEETTREEVYAERKKLFNFVED